MTKKNPKNKPKWKRNKRITITDHHSSFIPSIPSEHLKLTNSSKKKPLTQRVMATLEFIKRPTECPWLHRTYMHSRQQFYQRKKTTSSLPLPTPNFWWWIMINTYAPMVSAAGTCISGFLLRTHPPTADMPSEINVAQILAVHESVRVGDGVNGLGN